jgi:hypothetical protein
MRSALLLEGIQNLFGFMSFHLPGELGEFNCTANKVNYKWISASFVRQEGENDIRTIGRDLFALHIEKIKEG